jgi:tetratricopeptide (TPR) repeat protein
MSAPSAKPFRHLLYNPLRQDPEELERLYVARLPLFEKLLSRITDQPAGAVPRHHLIIGQRGMGKTTLLARLAVALRKEDQPFLPLSFWEEQHIEVDRLSVFWLNCLDSLADAFQAAGEETESLALDREIKQIAAIKSEEECARTAKDAFAKACEQSERRIVLLIDNFNLLLTKLKRHDHALRSFFTRHGSPIIVGAAITPPLDLSDYDAAFYDGFETTLLHRLSLEETKDMILRLAREHDQPEVVQNLWRDLPRLAALRDLSGGNPRTSLLIYRLCARGFSDDIYRDLEALLDETTPLFQSRFEQLSDQSQKLVARLARHWVPASAETITALTDFPRGTVSPLLGKLEDDGILERVALYDRERKPTPKAKQGSLSKRPGYQLAERFFNIWIIMRSASRRERSGVVCLSRFLMGLYTEKEQAAYAQSLTAQSSLNWGQAILGRALAESLVGTGSDCAYDLKIKSENTLLTLASKGSQELEGIIEPDAINRNVHEHVEIRKQLLACVPATAQTKPDEFADLVMGSLSMLNSTGISRGVIRQVFKRQHFDVDRVANDLRAQEAEFKTQVDDESMEWFRRRLLDGLLQNVDDADAIKAAIPSAPNARALELLGNLVEESLPELALEIHSKAIQKDPKSYHAWAGLAKIHILAKRYKEAKRAYQEALAFSDESAAVCANFGMLLSSQFKQYSEAEKWLRRSVDLDPRDDTALHNLGTTLALQKTREKAEEAIVVFRRAAALNLANPTPWIRIGEIQQLTLKDFPAAETSYRKALSMSAKAADARTHLGNLLFFDRGETEEAEEQFQKAIADGSEDAATWVGLGVILMNHRKRFEEAEATFKEGLNKSKPALCWVAYGDLLMHYFERFAEAENALQEAIKDEPALHQARWSLGKLNMYFLGQPEKAKPFIEEATKLDPENPGYWNTLGVLEYDYLNNSSGAVVCFKKVISLNPCLDAPRHNLAFLLRDTQNDIQGAKAILTSLQQPENWKDVQALHRTLFAAYDKNWGLAEESLRQALNELGDTGFPMESREDWYRASAVLLHLGYGQDLVNFLKAEKQDNKQLPWFAALDALTLGDRQVLLNIPDEARDAAGKIFDHIARLKSNLPTSSQ